MAIRISATILAHICLLIAQISWGSLAVIAKGGLSVVHPSIFMIFRIGGSLPFYFGLAFYKERHLILPSAWPQEDRKRLILTIIFLGFVGISSSSQNLLSLLTILLLIGVSLTQALYVLGIYFSTATNVVILELGVPVWGAIAGILLKRESFAWIKVFGIFLAITGGLVMLEVEKFQWSADVAIGNLCIIIMTFTYGLGYLTTGDYLFKKVPPFVANSWLYTVALVIDLVIGLSVWSHEWKVLGEIEGYTWFELWYSVFIGTALPFMLLSWALKHVSSLVAAIYEPLETVTGVMFSIIILHEQPSVRTILGGLILIAGVLTVIGKKFHEEKKNNSDKTTIEDQWVVLEDASKNEEKVIDLDPNPSTDVRFVELDDNPKSDE